MVFSSGVCDVADVVGHGVPHFSGVSHQSMGTPMGSVRGFYRFWRCIHAALQVKIFSQNPLQFVSQIPEMECQVMRSSPDRFVHLCWERVSPIYSLSHRIGLTTRLGTHFSSVQLWHLYSWNLSILTHWGLMTPCGDKNSGQHWLR